MLQGTCQGRVFPGPGEWPILYSKEESLSRRQKSGKLTHRSGTESWVCFLTTDLYKQPKPIATFPYEKTHWLPSWGHLWAHRVLHLRRQVPEIRHP